MLFQFSSVQFSHSVGSNSLWPHELPHSRPPCPSPAPGVHTNSCAPSQWCHPAISSSVIPFSSCLQSLPASGSFPMSQITGGGQSTGVSASASVLPMNTWDWSPLEWTGWISLQSKGLSSCCLVQLFCDALDYYLPGPWAFSGKNTGMGCHFLLLGILLTQELNSCLFHLQAASLPPSQPLNR